MSNSDACRVLSLNTYIMGHVTYHDMLERTFLEHFPEVQFQGVKLTQYRQPVVNKVLYHLLTMRAPGCQDTDWDFSRLRYELGSSLFARACLDKLMSQYKPDVLHIHTQAIAFLSIPVFRKIPAVVNIDYTAALLAKEHPFPAALTYQPIITLEKRCFSGACHVVTWNERARRSVIEHYSIPECKVTTVHPAVPLTPFLSMERKNVSDSGKPRLLFVGNDFKRKGGHDLLAVYLDGLNASCQLDIVTNAEINVPEQDGLRIHKGLRPLDQALLKLYENADIFVMPTYEDVFPMVFVEAMAAGLPLIGTAVMAVPELVKHNENGLVVQPGDRQQLKGAIELLIVDVNLRRTLGESARKLAQKDFDNVSSCKELARIFTACAKQR